MLQKLFFNIDQERFTIFELELFSFDFSPKSFLAKEWEINFGKIHNKEVLILLENNLNQELQISFRNDRSTITKKTCTEFHILNHTTDDPYEEDGRYSCNICNIDKETTSGVFHCEKCEYDICPDCAIDHRN